MQVSASGLPHVDIVIGGRQGHAPCKVLLLQQIFFVSVNFHGDQGLSQR